MLCGRIVNGSYGFVAPGSCVGVSLTVAMALSRQVACAGAWLAVVMAFCAKPVVVAKTFRAKAVRAYRAVAKSFGAKAVW